MSPLAMFLFSVFLMLAVMSLLGSPASFIDEDGRSEINAGLNNRLEELDAELLALRPQHEAAAAQGESTGDFDAQIRDRVEEREVIAISSASLKLWGRIEHPQKARRA